MRFSREILNKCQNWSEKLEISKCVVCKIESVDRIDYYIYKFFNIGNSLNKCSCDLRFNIWEGNEQGRE
ncbi:unnamed protein product [Moneuplotes crassus]|uniref:Uncharacterized protein n=1 Tax=Euplotes crassus TaxID=5936 RepID=A0AAD1XII2_EUPCR|nr:unnamed protein product [Moneuplotes crassus]